MRISCAYRPKLSDREAVGKQTDGTFRAVRSSAWLDGRDSTEQEYGRGIGGKNYDGHDNPTRGIRPKETLWVKQAQIVRSDQGGEANACPKRQNTAEFAMARPNHKGRGDDEQCWTSKKEGENRWPAINRSGHAAQSEKDVGGDTSPNHTDCEKYASQLTR